MAIIAKPIFHYKKPPPTWVLKFESLRDQLLSLFGLKWNSVLGAR